MAAFVLVFAQNVTAEICPVQTFVSHFFVVTVEIQMPSLEYLMTTMKKQLCQQGCDYIETPLDVEHHAKRVE